MKSIQLNKENLTLNEVTIMDWKTIKEEDFLSSIPSSKRVFDVGRGATIYVFDKAGLRFWVREGALYQGQVVLERKEDEKFPTHVYDGNIFIDHMEMKFPITLEQLKNVKELKLEKDLDSIQYGLNIYSGLLGSKKYTFYVDKKDEYVSSIWI
jgi:hypothetical protein